MSAHEPPVGAEPDHTLVVMQDGTEHLVPARVGDLVAFELAHGRPANTASVADVMWIVHRAVGDERPLQEWADAVARLARDDDEIEAARERLSVPPTRLAAAGDG